MTRFERATPSSQAKCATKLRYIPKYLVINGKTFVLPECATPLTNRYLIDLFGRVLHPKVFSFHTDIPIQKRYKTILIKRNIIVKYYKYHKIIIL